MKLQIQLLHPAAQIPTNKLGDAGWDLYSIEDVFIHGGETRKVKTGIAMKIPDGHVGLILDRSSLGSRGITHTAGVIDSSYTGEIIICLANLANDDFYHIKSGDKVAQIVIVPYPSLKIELVDQLQKTSRGSSGFGSTGR